MTDQSNERAATSGPPTDACAPLATPDPAPSPRTNGPPYAETIPGKRFFLRRLMPGDVTHRYVGWMNDAEVIRYVQARFDPRDLASLRRHVAGYDHNDGFFFGIFENETADHIGNISMKVNPHHLFANMGYLIGEKKHWVGDAALQACYLLFDFAFNERGVRKIVDCTTDNHIASNFNFRRMGFTYEGKIPDLYWGEGQYRAAIYWSLSATEWAERGGRSPAAVTP